MTFNAIQSAVIQRALKTLDADPEFSHSLSVIRNIAGSGAVEEIKARKVELDADNENAPNLLDTLEPEALTYHERVAHVISLGKRAQTTGNEKLLKRVSHDSERLCEVFEEMVPDCDRDKFLVHGGDDDARDWDERWEYLEFRPPLLRPEYLTTYVHSNPMNMAQREVLGSLIPFEPMSKEEVLASLERQREAIKPQYEEAAAARAKAAKALEKLKRAARRQQLIDQGDQKATKRQRKKAFKVVGDAFENLSERKGGDQ